eukprot:TRINITY_DN9725_c0_g1_i1.p1 TRINITY_DN9725_c0_g1~~TRINITY_DN9725_c0_g1_i1.p1  ORF type:complete len:485 (+),score=134.16 TRINITY_DN9725_c0_g1_i1:125-1579(+)
MEEFKDVMLSEPPAARAHGDGGHRSFENFKGILLCDRPTDHRVVQGVAEQPFLPPGRPDKDLFGFPGQELEGGLGLQPSQEKSNRHNVARQARMENNKNIAPTALSKHRKWLKSLSEETKKLKLDAVEATLLKDHKQQRFQEVERKKRKMIRAERSANDLDGPTAGHVMRAGKPDTHALVEDSPPESVAEDDMDDGILPPTPPADSASLPRLSPSAEEASAHAEVATQKSETGSSKRKGKKKPKWAMTKQEAREAEDEQFDEEMKDAQALVDFFEKLDIEKVIDDPEVRESLSIALERVEEIAEEQGVDAAAFRRADGPSPRRADDSVSVATSQCTDRSAALERKRLRELRKRQDSSDPQQISDRDWDASSRVGVDKVRQALSGDAMRLAEQILAKSEGLRKVHSSKSLARILEELVIQRFAGGGTKSVPPAPAVREPVVADIRPQAVAGQPDDKDKARRVLTALRNSKEYVQNLPYLYRCPSI